MHNHAFKENAHHIGDFEYPDLKQLYPSFLPGLVFDLQKAEITHHDPDIIPLAQNLINAAIGFDLQKTKELLLSPFQGSIGRDFDTPLFYEHDSLRGQVWADNPVFPLGTGQQWNEHSRKTNCGLEYKLDERGYPLTPYLKYGVKGRGFVGLYGPNHAVDMAPVRVQVNEKGIPALSVLGIIRKDSGRPALCGGFTTFEKTEDGRLLYTKKAMIQSQTHECFEEMISGSVELLPAYSEGLEEEIKGALKARASAQGHVIGDKQTSVIRNQIITIRKLRQVETEDPEFMQRLEKAFSTANECYAGPVLSSARNTDNACMETRLSWFQLDENKWNEIKGDNKFNYDFKAGDDAAAVLWHEITPKLLEEADSHGAYFCYVLGSYLLTTEDKDKHLLSHLKVQAKELIDFMVGRPPVVCPKQALMLDN